MQSFDLYLNESYNDEVFCVGGFAARSQLWVDQITPKWQERIEYERRQSISHGFQPITHYHASDSSNLKKEFAPKHGWDKPRLHKFSKRLCEIVAQASPWGIVVGGRTADMERYLKLLATGSDCPKESLYDLSFRLALMIVTTLVHDSDPSAKVNVVFDQTEDYGSVANRAFDSIKQDALKGDMEDVFVETQSADSRECVPLQLADFMAYEGMKRVDAVRTGRDQIRKSLQVLIGKEIPIDILQFTDQNFDDIHRMLKNHKAGRPLGEGVTSAISGVIQSGKPAL